MADLVILMVGVAIGHLVPPCVASLWTRLRRADKEIEDLLKPERPEDLR